MKASQPNPESKRTMVFYAENGKRLSPKKIRNLADFKPAIAKYSTKFQKSKQTKKPVKLANMANSAKTVRMTQGKSQVAINIYKGKDGKMKIKGKNSDRGKIGIKKFGKGYKEMLEVHEEILASALGPKRSSPEVMPLEQFKRPMTAQPKSLRYSQIFSKQNRPNLGGYQTKGKTGSSKLVKHTEKYDRYLYDQPSKSGQFSSFGEAIVEEKFRKSQNIKMTKKIVNHSNLAGYEKTNSKISETSSTGQNPVKHIFSNLQIVNSNIYFPMMSNTFAEGTKTGNVLGQHTESGGSLSMAPTIQWKNYPLGNFQGKNFQNLGLQGKRALSKNLSEKSLKVKTSSKIRIDGVKRTKVVSKKLEETSKLSPKNKAKKKKKNTKKKIVVNKKIETAVNDDQSLKDLISEFKESPIKKKTQNQTLFDTPTQNTKGKKLNSKKMMKNKNSNGSKISVKSKFLENSQKKKLKEFELSLLDDIDQEENSMLLGGRRRENSLRNQSMRSTSQRYRQKNILSKSFQSNQLKFKNLKNPQEKIQGKNYLAQYENKIERLSKHNTVDPKDNDLDDILDEIKFEVSEFKANKKVKGNFSQKIFKVKSPISKRSKKPKRNLEKLSKIKKRDQKSAKKNPKEPKEKSKKLEISFKQSKSQSNRKFKTKKFQKKKSRNNSLVSLDQSKTGSIKKSTRKVQKSKLGILRKKILSTSFEISPIKNPKNRRLEKKWKKEKTDFEDIEEVDLSEFGQSSRKARNSVQKYSEISKLKEKLAKGREKKPIGSILDKIKRENFKKEMQLTKPKTTKNMNTLSSKRIRRNTNSSRIQSAKTHKFLSRTKRKSQQSSSKSIKRKLNSPKFGFKAKLKKNKIPKFERLYYMDKLMASISEQQVKASVFKTAPADTDSNISESEGNDFYRHFIQSTQSTIYIKSLIPPKYDDLLSKQVYLPPLGGKKKTVIFDLDETLIHCNEDPSAPCDLRVPIKFSEGEIVEAGLTIRPHARECLKELSEVFEVVVFTASHACYANIVLNILDPKNEFITFRLYRENCYRTKDGIFVKDLRVFANRDPKDLILIDNAYYSYGFNVTNGVPILPFYDDKDDQELKELTEFLKKIKDVEDVREVLKKVFMGDLYEKYAKRAELLARLMEKNYRKLVD